MANVKLWGAVAATVIILTAAGVWLILVGFAVNEPQVLAEDGKTVVLDQFGRAKEILTLLLPLVTTALGYWVGAKGTDAAKEETAKTKKQRNAFRDVAIDKATAGEDIYRLALQKAPEAFK